MKLSAYSFVESLIYSREERCDVTGHTRSQEDGLSETSSAKENSAVLRRGTENVRPLWKHSGLNVRLNLIWARTQSASPRCHRYHEHPCWNELARLRLLFFVDVQEVVDVQTTASAVEVTHQCTHSIEMSSSISSDSCDPYPGSSVGNFRNSQYQSRPRPFADEVQGMCSWSLLHHPW